MRYGVLQKIQEEFEAVVHCASHILGAHNVQSVQAILVDEILAETRFARSCVA